MKLVYDLVIEVGTHPVSNIKTAEAVKVVENSQRDINIALLDVKGLYKIDELKASGMRWWRL